MGAVAIKDGIIDIMRLNTEGRIEIHLKSYKYGKRVQKIPANIAISGKRHFRITCDVKAIGGRHTLRFSFKGDSQTTWDDTEYEVSKDTWETITLAFTVPANDPCFLRIDDVKVSKTPSNVYIKNLVLYEKKPA